MEQLIELQLRYNDFDGQKIVNNAAAFSLIENAHLIFFENIIGNRWDWTNVPLVLSKIKITFLTAINTKTNLLGSIKILRIESNFIELRVQLLREESIFCVAKIKIVHYDFSLKQSTPWKDEILSLLKEHF